MNAFRKIVLACIASIALVSPAMFPTQSQAAAPAVKGAQARYYYVYYRTCASDRWHYYGAYRRANDAWLAVRWFQYYGYQAYYI